MPSANRPMFLPRDSPGAKPWLGTVQGSRSTRPTQMNDTEAGAGAWRAVLRVGPHSRPREGCFWLPPSLQDHPLKTTITIFIWANIFSKQHHFFQMSKYSELSIRHCHLPSKSYKYTGTSPVAQWLSPHLPIQGCRFNPWSGNLVYYTCLKAKKPNHKTEAIV